MNRKKIIIILIIVLLITLIVILFFTQPQYFRYLEGEYVSLVINEKKGSDGIMAPQKNLNKPYESNDSYRYLPEEVSFLCEIIKISDLPEEEIGILPNATEDEVYKFYIKEKIRGEWTKQELNLFNRNIFFGKDDANLFIKVRVFCDIFNDEVKVLRIKVAYENQWIYSSWLRIHS